MTRTTRSIAWLLILAALFGCDEAPPIEPEPDAGARPRRDATVAADASPAADAAASVPDTGPVVSVPDPELTGMLPIGFIDDSTVSAGGSTFSVHCLAPISPSPLPAVVLLHGFRIDPVHYQGTQSHIASFGYVVCVPDYPAGFIPDHVQNVAEVRGVIDYLLGSTFLFSVDPSKIAIVGHSLGGKIGVMTAREDARVKAYVGLDPVDGAMACNTTRCPDASDMLPLSIPTAFFGETIDSTPGPGGRACAPPNDNYSTFFARATSPSVEVTFTKANHMSFVDDPAQCGLTCSVCNDEQLPHADLIRTIRGYLVAFLQVHLRGETAYNFYLKDRPGLVTLRAR